MFIALVISAVCLSPPVNGPVIAGYSPAGEYAGHWGVDYEARSREQVRAPASGVVTFAGSVAGMKSITVEPLPGLKVSISYLRAIGVSTGDRVAAGQVIGDAGKAHGRRGVHLSVRIEGRYVDPATQMGCRKTDVSRALRLVVPPQPYPRARAHRNTRRNLRPYPSRPSPRR